MHFLKELDLSLLNENNPNTCIIPINNNIQGKRELISTISRGINSPYVDDNWDGLNDALQDLSWVSEHEVKIIHYDLPLLSDSDMRIYLEILKIVDDFWKTINVNGYIHNYNCEQVNIYFRDSLEELVMSVIGDDGALQDFACNS